jgi:hypothetical protein
MKAECEYSMGAEFDALDDETKEAVRLLVNKVRRTGYGESEPFRVGDIFAYPLRGGEIAWGVNGPPQQVRIARGISKPTN